MAIEIEKNVPVPTGRGVGKAKSSAYPFEGMEVGDSFVLDEDATRRVRSAAERFKKTHRGWTYKTKTSIGRIRLWRIS